ncbi:MAG: hypothetical protein KF709_10890 [Gemmatimonadaceae bacterium]|nr:hypothetical protein [Gemmatimonadaceae bacterium]
MKLLWPPRPLGLGTPLGLAAPSGRTRPDLLRDLRLVPVFGIFTALLIVAVDVLLFYGATIGRMPSLDDHPAVVSRVFVSLFGGVLEEVMFRLMLATFIAWLAYLALSRVVEKPKE